MSKIRHSAKAGTRSRSRESFLESADALLEQALAARASQDLATALEYAYQAGLRTAGARIASSPVIAARKRLPSGAWEQLALVGAESAAWAEKLGSFSRIRSRVASGIEPHVPVDVLDELIALVQDFNAQTVGGEGHTAAAA
ncbi:hypothetical protein CAQU_08480 [Corynebacterium aquilae DSM 44791]|uniref:SAV-6107-like HEPN domain-containing protein n=1 Tax=Corynebacterium aquilae DSM 44791 TaxID=1431546 RepID=A0A1L7CGW8_9CORY|nr:hypothetical protein CAQU_08480 [Corynebacterium aquilae DSM 44791]